MKITLGPTQIFRKRTGTKTVDVLATQHTVVTTSNAQMPRKLAGTANHARGTG